MKEKLSSYAVLVILALKKDESWRVCTDCHVINKITKKYCHLSTNAPNTFMSLMNYIFRHFIDKFIIVYFDDIMIYNKRLEEHGEHLLFVLDVLRK